MRSKRSLHNRYTGGTVVQFIRYHRKAVGSIIVRVLTRLNKGSHLSHELPVLLTPILRAQEIEPLDVRSELNDSCQLGLTARGFLGEHMDVNTVLAKCLIHIVGMQPSKP